MYRDFAVGSEESNKPPFWIALGASAGGLEALTEFLQGFEAGSDAYLIIAQHLDPKHPTILKELLERSTTWKVELITQDIKPKTETVYIVSPGHNARYDQGRICLSPAAAIGPKPSIDTLLTSLAQQVGERTIAVILSGTGSDGAQGVMAVKSANGFVFAQDQRSAKYTGMPNAAVDTGVVDVVQSPREIAKKISEFVYSDDFVLKSSGLVKNQSAIDQVFKLILEHTGVDFSGYKYKTIKRRIARRMAVHRLVSLEDYVNLLQDNSDEIDSLSKDFLISVTAFFRDKEPFEGLSEVIEQLVHNCTDEDSLRIWVPGCANGEEAYSIAILIQQAMIKFRRHCSYQIFASDIDETALAQARRGAYSSAQVEEIPPEIMQLYFEPRDGHFFVSKRVRDHVVFAKQNVVADPPFSKVDLISCRNLLIYFSAELQRRVFQRFHYALKPSGYLFLGKSESALNSSPELFTLVKPKCQIFQRKNINLSAQVDQIESANNYARSIRGPSKVIQNEEKTILNRLDEELLNHVVPATIVVDNSGQILQIRGNVNRYLAFPQGKIDTNIITLAREDIKIDIRSLLAKARTEGQAASQCLFFASHERELLFVSIRRIEIVEDSQDYFMVSFLPVKSDDAMILDPNQLTEVRQATNDKLISEVAVFKERLQTSVEELETTNEELQSTNEELQSANEELQSTNEELQTANEELQSTNEELSTVNEELEVKGYELEKVNNDLENILRNIDEPIIILDSRLRIMRMTNSAKETFDIPDDAMHQTLNTIGLKVDIPDLKGRLLSVQEGREEQDVELSYNEINYRVRITPIQSVASHSQGLMLSFQRSGIDLVEPLEGQSVVETIESFCDDLNQGVIVCTHLGSIVYVNRFLSKVTGYTKEELKGESINILMPEPFKTQHDGYLSAHAKGQGFGTVVGHVRDITIVTKESARLLMRIRVNEIWLHNRKHFIAKLDGDDGNL